MTVVDESTLQESRLRSLELATVMDAGRAFPAAYALILAALATLLRPAVEPAAFWAWCGAFVGYIALRTFATQAYHADALRDDAVHVERWRAWLAVSGVMFGGLFGSLAFFAFPRLDVDARLVLTMIVAVVTTGSAAHVAALRRLPMLVICSSLPCFVWAWWQWGGEWRQLMTLALAFGTAGNLHMAWNSHRVLRRGFLMALRHEAVQQELREKNAELERAGEARKNLFAMAGHDLRQPVHAMGLTVAQLRETDPPELLHPHFERLRESSALVSDMLQDLMDLSQLERDTYTPRLDEVALDTIFEQVRLAQAPLAARKGLRLDFAPAGAVWLRTDAHLLRRILLNLVSNAVKYTATGGVTVDWRRVGGTVHLCVADSGVGIPPDKLGAIFNDYVRLPEAALEGDGMGLGLSIVRRAAQLLGYEVEARSVPGQGSRFEVALPVAAAPGVATGSHIVPPPPPPPPALAASGTVVVVENDGYALDALRGLLHGWGFDVAAAASLPELLAQPFDADALRLVISDMDLQAQDDGLAVIAALRARRPALPAILLTGDTRPELAARAAGANIRIAHKPLPAMQLRDAVAAALAG